MLVAGATGAIIVIDTLGRHNDDETQAPDRQRLNKLLFPKLKPDEPLK